MKKNAASSSSGKPDAQKSYKKNTGREPGSETGRPYKKPGAAGSKGERSSGSNKSEDRSDASSHFNRPGSTYKKRSAEDGSGSGKGERTSKTDRSHKSFDGTEKKFSDRKGPFKPGARGDAGGDRSRPSAGASGRPARPYNGRTVEGAGDDRPKRLPGERPGRPYTGDKPRPPFNEGKPKRSFGDRPKPFGDDKPGRPFGEERSKSSFDGDKHKRPYGKDKETGAGRPKRNFEAEDKPKRLYSKDKEAGPYDKQKPKRTTGAARPERKLGEERPARKPKEDKPIESPMTLNKYVSHSGECSRRAAAEMVKQGKVKVNGELVLDPGYRVEPGDQVSLGGKKLTPQRNLVYILLNKPKDFITTTDDPEGRKTVMDLVESAEVGRVYPIGRLDRNTTGLILLTNDGVLAQKLSHPSHNVRKVYQVTLDKNLTRADYDKIVKGFELEDGMVQVDALAYLETRHELGIEIHSGKNRIVRRIFESLGYVVEKLDRVSYAGLTKKNLPRGKWRFLDEKETILLKHFKN